MTDPGRNMSRTETLELLIVINVAITTSAIFYMLTPVTGFFGALSIAFINDSIVHSTGNLLLYSSIDASAISGDQVYMYTFHILTGISFDTMMQLPVNHVLIAISLFCLAKRLTRSRQRTAAISLSAAVSIVYLLNTAYVVEDMSFFVKGAGTFLFVAFLVLLLQYFTARTVPTMIGILILFVANGFFDYTAQVWMIIAVIPPVVLGLIRSREGQPVRLWNVLALMLTILLAYRAIIYAAYLPWITQLLVSSSIQNFVHSLPFFRDVSGHPFQGNRPFAPLVFLANALTYGSTAAFTGYNVLHIAWMKTKKQKLTMENLVFVCLLLPLPLTLAIYLPIGVFNLSYVALMLPLLGAYSIWLLAKEGKRFTSRGVAGAERAKPEVLFATFLAALLVLGGVSFVGSLQAGTMLQSSNSNMKPAANWLFEETSGKISVLSDIDSLGKFLVVRSSFAVGSFDDLSIEFYDADLYARLVQPNYTQGNFNRNFTQPPTYVVVDARTTYPVQSLNWTYFEPLSKHLVDIDNNAQVSQVYDDGTCLIEVWYAR